MTEKQLKKIIKEMKAFGKKLLDSKEESRKFLIKTGIYTKTGKLSSHYK